MITISKPVPEDATGMNEVIKLSWYKTYVVPEVGITKEDVDQMYAESETQQIEVFKKRALNPKDGDITLVAKMEGKIVGVVRLVTFDDHFRVRTFYVHPDHEGQGIGTSLWEEVVKLIPHDKPVVAWPVKNTKSVDFYKKLGFITTGEEGLGAPMPSGSRMLVLKSVFNF